jgi:hypothetical protein
VRRTFEPVKEEITVGWSKWHSAKFHNIFFIKYYLGEDKTGEAVCVNLELQTCIRGVARRIEMGT